jgi:DNA topoisomerase VI subunit B
MKTFSEVIVIMRARKQQTPAAHSANSRLERTAFRTSRLLDFCSDKELTAQIGHPREAWLVAAFKELMDNALDSAEDLRVAPKITVQVDQDGIEVRDNGAGIPPDVVDDVLDFAVRVSTRASYVSPTRGSQGLGLKTIVAMPYVLDGTHGRVTIDARGLRQEIIMKVDRIRQTPIIERQQSRGLVKKGTSVRIHWPEVSRTLLDASRSSFLQMALGYTFLNPHLQLTLRWLDKEEVFRPTNPGWRKWLPSDPTSPHWYRQEHLEKLVAAYIAHDRDHGRDRPVRELVQGFRGLTGTPKQKAVHAALGMARTPLSELADGEGLNANLVGRLLQVLKAHSKPVQPVQLGVIGKDHLAACFERKGCEMATFEYRKSMGEKDGVPEIVETAFAWRPEARSRGDVTGVNWSPGILNPFRQLGRFLSLDGVLQEQRVGVGEPVMFLLHLASPRPEYTDRGKSAVVVGSSTNEEE